MEPINVSVIIPCYNSASVLAKNLPYLIDNLEQAKISNEIIIVNDGSSDEAELQKAISSFPVTYLSYKFNRGKGEALRKGFKAARGDIQIFTDPDIPYTFEAFRKIIHHLSNHEADLVIGNRFLKGSVYYYKIGFVRRWGSRLVSLFLGTLVTGGYYDTQCGIKGFSRKAAEKIFAWSSVDRFAIDIEAIYLALKFRYTIKKISVEWRSADGNTVKVLNDGVRLIKDVFSIKYNYEKKVKNHEW